MREHRQRVLDHRYQVLMVTKTKSSNPREAQIGRQGQALRTSCIMSQQQTSEPSSPDTDISSVHQFGGSLRRVSTDLSEADASEELQKLLGRMPKWEPGSFGRHPRSRTAPTYENILMPQSIRRGFPEPNPTERCELSNHEMQMRLWGGTYWFCGPDWVPEREPQSWNQMPLAEQRDC